MVIAIKNFITDTGNYGVFFLKFFRNLFHRFEWNEFFRQCYLIGYKSFSIVCLTGFVIGFVLSLQSIPTLKDFGALTYVPGMVAISVIREIGPVIIALICTGKIASGIGAELGSMRVTEQIDAMEVSGANPVQYLVVTRILACMLMVPLLTLFADAFAIAGGFTGFNTVSQMTMGLYFRKSFASVLFADLFPAVIKTLFFGFVIGFIGCYKGMYSKGGTESVGVAAKSAVVTASVWVIIIDAVVVQLVSIFFY